MLSNPYTLPIVKWWRLIVIVTVLATGASTVSAMFQPQRYVSTSTLAIGTAFANPNPDSGQIYIAQQLAQVYAEMARQEPIQNATMAALGISWLPQYQSRVVPNTQFVEISVTDTNPKRAQIVANELANQLKLQSPTIGNTETGGRQGFIKAELSSLQDQIQQTENSIEELQKSQIGLSSASQLANIETEISTQNDKLTNLRASYASFLAESQQGAVNIVTIVDPANLPAGPVGVSKFIIVLLAALVGFSLGTGTAYLLEYLDQTIKNTSDVERIFKLPVIGYISEIPDDRADDPSVVEDADSVLAENFRLLHSNIEFYRISNRAQTILITSPSQGTGKTTIASNLAQLISEEGGDVILVDADLRRPAVHSRLKMTREPGLSDVFSDHTDIQSVIRQRNGKESLRVITAGNTPSKTTGTTGSRRIAAVLSSLKESYGLVIVDAPPLLLADAFNLASAVDAVVLVVEPGATGDRQAKAIKEQLDRANAKILGIVLNKISEESADSRYDYQYRSLYSAEYYSDYSSAARTEPPSDARSKALLHFFERGSVPVEIASAYEKWTASIKLQLDNLRGRVRKPNKEG